MSLEKVIILSTKEQDSSNDKRLAGMLHEILVRLDRLEKQGELIMASFTDIKALLVAIDEDTSAIAVRIDELLTKISTSMSQAEVDEVAATLTSISEHLDALAKDEADPVPPVDPA